MNDTLSELYSSAYSALTLPPDDILQRSDLANIVLRRLSHRLEGIRQSEQSVAIIKSATFTMDNGENTKDLTAEIDDFVVPMWAEYRGWDYLQNPVWYFLPTVHLSMLAKERALGKYACSFYGENSRQVTIETSLYGNEVYAPFNEFQVFYLPTVPLPESESETIKLPDNLITMLLLDTLVSALPLMIGNAAKQTLKNPQLKDQMAVWTMMLGEYKQERAEFAVLYDKWLKESRGSHRPRRRGDILANRLGNGGGRNFFVTGNS